MAVKSRTNLIEEFLGEKNNDLILLTTYSFDPVFFDYYLLPKLAENNPFAEVLVFVDGYAYQQAYPRFTPRTGTEYRLIPVYQEGGVFHPKVGVFFSGGKDRARVFIGSANLTLAGFTRNAEIVLQAEFSPARGSPFLLDLMELFLRLFESKRRIDNEAHELVKNVYSELSGGGSSGHSGLWVLHNFTEPILDRLCRVLEGKRFPHMRVVAPFFSSSARTLFKQVRDRLSVREIVIGVQKRNHNLEPGTVKRYSEVAEELGLRLEFKEAVFREEDRRIHAKLIQLDGAGESVLLVGSPNFTEPALLSTSQDGNLEVAVLLSNGFENLINEILFEEPQFSDDFWSRRPENEGEVKRLLEVYSAEYDEVGKRILINLEPLTCKLSCKVRYTNNEEEEHSYDMSEGRVTLTLRKQQSNPREVVIRAEDGRCAVVRVYIADTFKRVMRGDRRVTVKDALRVIDSRQSVDLDEILLLLSRLTTTESERSDIGAAAVKRGRSDRPRDRTFELPRKSTKETSIGNITRRLEETVRRFLRTRAIQKEMKRAIEDTDEDNVDRQKDRGGGRIIAVDFIKHKDYKKNILRCLEKLWEQLRSEDCNQNIKVATLATEVVVRILLRERDEDFIEEFERNKLYSYLEDLDTSNLDRETLKSFFFYLLKLNYISDYIIDRMIFIRDLFDCRVFTDPEVFSEVRGKFVGFIENAKDFGVVFDEEKFMAIYGNLIASTLSPSSVGESVRTLVRNLVNCKHQGIRKVSYHALLSFLNHVPLTAPSSVKEEIRKILKTERLEENVSKLLEDIVQTK